MRFSIFDPRYSPTKRIRTCPNQSKVHAKQHDLLFDQIETYAKCIDLLFESRKGYAKRYIRYFCRGVLHTLPQDSPKRNV